MPRQTRLDTPGALHHIIGRGVEGTKIFRKEEDRIDFINRLDHGDELPEVMIIIS